MAACPKKFKYGSVLHYYAPGRIQVHKILPFNFQSHVCTTLSLFLRWLEERPRSLRGTGEFIQLEVQGHDDDSLCHQQHHIDW